MRYFIISWFLIFISLATPKAKDVVITKSENNVRMMMKCDSSYCSSSFPKKAEMNMEPPMECGRWSQMRLKPSERRKHLERFRMEKLLELLNLDKKSEKIFVNMFRQHRQEQRKLKRKRITIINDLADTLKFNSSNVPAIKNMLIKINALDKQKFELRQQFLNRIKTVLTPQQLGKLYVFQDRFEFEILEKMNKLHRWQGKPPRREEIENERIRKSY
ncbi:MAG: hypothetical protein GXO93_07155 [FCB group bacterium]|nr:hypothetical protein [FCB group bacterium]